MRLITRRALGVAFFSAFALAYAGYAGVFCFIMGAGAAIFLREA